MTEAADEAMRRMGAPTCPKCDQLGIVRRVEWCGSAHMELLLCKECAGALEEMDHDLDKLDESLSDSISLLTSDVEPLRSVGWNRRENARVAVASSGGKRQSSARAAEPSTRCT